MTVSPTLHSDLKCFYYARHLFAYHVTFTYCTHHILFNVLVGNSNIIIFFLIASFFASPHPCLSFFLVLQTQDNEQKNNNNQKKKNPDETLDAGIQYSRRCRFPWCCSNHAPPSSPTPPTSIRTLMEQITWLHVSGCWRCLAKLGLENTSTAKHQAGASLFYIRAKCK